MVDERPNQPQPAYPDVVPDQPQADPVPNGGSDPVVRQLDAIIENVTSYATPVLREIAARAAELAAKAGQAAGPMAYRAAERTGELGDRVASRSRVLASDLRRDPASPPADGDAGHPAPDDLVPAP